MLLKYSKYLCIFLACAGLGAMEEPPAAVQSLGFFNDIALPDRPNDDAWKRLFSELEATRAFMGPPHVIAIARKFSTHYTADNPMCTELYAFRGHNALKAVREAARGEKNFLHVARVMGGPENLVNEMKIYCSRGLGPLDRVSYADVAGRCKRYSLNKALARVQRARERERERTVGGQS